MSGKESTHSVDLATLLQAQLFLGFFKARVSSLMLINPVSFLTLKLANPKQYFKNESTPIV